MMDRKMTSLQRAMNSPRTSLEVTHNNMTREKNKGIIVAGGAFESCFADGLDLSEFCSSSSSSQRDGITAAPAASHGRAAAGTLRQRSAAAELMHIKAMEAERAAREEREELLLAQCAAQRAREESERLASSSLLMAERNRTDADAATNSCGEKQRKSNESRQGSGTEFFGGGEDGIFSALVQMHGDDENGANREQTGSSGKNKRMVSWRRNEIDSQTKGQGMGNKRANVSPRRPKQIGRKSRTSGKYNSHRNDKRGLVKRTVRTKY